MSGKRKWSSTAKFEIAMQAIKGEMTLNELCKMYGVSPSQVHAWKKQLLESGVQVFNKADKAAKVATAQEEARRALYEKIGELTVERDFLKKCWSKLSPKSDGS